MPAKKRTIIIAQAAGFCSGVKKALERAEKLETAYIFGSLIHNPQEVARLDKAGKHIVHSLDEVKGNQVVITAHGLDIKKVEEMKARGLEIIDTTCPLVTRIYKEGWKMQDKGRRIVIIGDPEHVEVRGIASRMQDPISVNSADDVMQIPADLKIGVICQSTLLQSKFDKFVGLLKERCADVEAVCTICQPTKDRQDASLELAKKANVMLVIGGHNSSNTHKLAQMAKEILGEENTHHIETVKELDPIWLEDKSVVGITAGASTPDYLIQEVVDAIEAMDEIGMT